MQPMKIEIPDTIRFEDLHLQRTPDGDIEFDWAPVEALCQHNRIDIAVFREAPEDNVSGLLMTWDRSHLENGGQRDPVCDDLIAEVQAEDERGGGISYPPGSA